MPVGGVLPPGAVSNQAGPAPVSPEPEKPAVVDRDALAQTFEREAARVFEYCRALVGREDVAARVAEAALGSARSMLADPDRLRAWLDGLAAGTDSGPSQGILLPASREAFELVYRHGIHRDDLGAVLGVPASEASALLAAAELELDRRGLPAGPDLAEEDPAEEDPAELAPGPAELIFGQPTLPDPDQLRAWLFALARREALAAGSSGAVDRAGPGAELARYTADAVAASGPADQFPPRSWWRGSVPEPTPPRRRARIAVLTAIPLAAAIGVAVYLGGLSHPVGSTAATGTGGAGIGSAGLPRLVLPEASPAVSAPRASPSPVVPISALFPAPPAPVAPPPLTSPPAPSPSPTPKPSPTPSPKPSPKPSPTPSPSPTKKSSASPTPKSTPKSTATPKPTSS